MLIEFLSEIFAILLVLVVVVIIAASRRNREKDSFTTTNINIEIREIQPMNVAAIRHIGPYIGDAELFGRLFSRVCEWAGPKGLMTPDTNYVSVYYENPQVTPPEKHRLDVCITVPEGTEGGDDIEVHELPGGMYAFGVTEVEKPEDYMKAWEELSAWVVNSDYDMDDRPAYELYEGEQNGPNRTVHMMLAVKPKA